MKKLYLLICVGLSTNIMASDIPRFPDAYPVQSNTGKEYRESVGELQSAKSNIEFIIQSSSFEGTKESMRDINEKINDTTWDIQLENERINGIKNHKDVINYILRKMD